MLGRFNRLKRFTCCSVIMRYMYRWEIVYYAQYRLLYCYIWNDKEQTYEKCLMHNCPSCGTTLPKNLLTGNGPDDPDIRSNVLAKELGKEYKYIKEAEIPQEFQTDEWWIKRGL